MTEKTVRKHQRSNAWEEAGLYWSFSEKAGLYWTKKKRGYFSRKSGAVTRINMIPVYGGASESEGNHRGIYIIY
jgi:hypothetical protein